jgi:hypothetical protein
MKKMSLIEAAFFKVPSLEGCRARRGGVGWRTGWVVRRGGFIPDIMN